MPASVSTTRRVREVARGDRMAGWTHTRTTSPTRRASSRSPCRRHPAEPIVAGLPVARHRRTGRGRRSCSGRSRAPRSRSRSRRSGRWWRSRRCSTPAGRGVAPGGRAAVERAERARRPPRRGRRASRSRARRRVASGRAGAAHHRARAADRLARWRRRGTSCSVAAPCGARCASTAHPSIAAIARCSCGGAARRRPGPGAAELGIGVVAPLAARPVVRARPDRAGREPVPPGCRRDRGSPRATHGRGRRTCRTDTAETRSSSSKRTSGPSASCVASRSATRRTIVVADEVDRLPPGLETVVARGVARPRARRAAQRGAPCVARSCPNSSARPRPARGRRPRARRRSATGIGTQPRFPTALRSRRSSQPVTPAGSRATLRVAVGVTAEGALELDLVEPRTARDRRRHHRQRQERVPPRVARRRWRGAIRPTGCRSSWSTSRAARPSSRSATCRTSRAS